MQVSKEEPYDEDIPKIRGLELEYYLAFCELYPSLNMR